MARDKSWSFDEMSLACTGLRRITRPGNLIVAARLARELDISLMTVDNEAPGS
jgi:hypothetical protein